MNTAAAHAIITSTIPRKVASTMPSLVDMAVGLIVMGKQPHPSIRTTVDITQPSTRVKKGACEIFVISSQDIGATILETTHRPYVVEVPMGMLLDPLAPTVNQTAIVQPIVKSAVLVEQTTHRSVIKEPVIQPPADPQLDIIVLGLKIEAILDEVMADSATATLLSNPNIVIVHFGQKGM